MDSLKESIEKISDDFQSTFTIVAPNMVSNLFFEKEIPVIEKIFKKHLGESVQLDFEKWDEVAQDYFIWVIKISGPDGVKRCRETRPAGK